MEELIKKRDEETNYEYGLRLIKLKKDGVVDIDWEEIVKLTGLELNKDSLRKANDTMYGGYNVAKYYEDKIANMLEKTQKKSIMDEFKEEIGEFRIAQQEARDRVNKMRALERKFIKSVEISKDIQDALREDLMDLNLFSFDRVESTNGCKLVIGVQDWHIGYVINNYKGNSYNVDILKMRLSKFISEIYKVCKQYNITDVVVVQGGDITENTYMRENQSFDCNMDYAHQISTAIKIFYEFVNTIASECEVNVDVISVGGNHSRMAKVSLEADNNNIVIKDTLKLLTEDNDRINVLDIDEKDDSCVFDVNGLLFKVLHGDNRVGDGKKLFDGECSMDEKKYSVIMRGHYHNFNVASQNSGGYIITGGCMFGYNPYSVKRMSCNTNASQTLILVGDSEIEFIKNVNLQIC